MKVSRISSHIWLNVSSKTKKKKKSVIRAARKMEIHGREMTTASSSPEKVSILAESRTAIASCAPPSPLRNAGGGSTARES